MSRGRGAFVVLLAHAVLVQVVSYALRPAISVAILDLGHGSAWLGVATAAFAVPPLVLAIPAGRLVDRVGERTSLLLGAAALVAAAVVALLLPTLAGLLVTTVLLGLGVLWSVVGEQAWVMRDAATGLDRRFGIYTFATSSGQMAGPALLLIPDGAGVAPAVAPVAGACLGIAVVGVALSLLVPSTARTSDDASVERMLPVASRLLRTRGVVPALVTSSLVLSSLDIALAYLPLLAGERSLSALWLTALLVTRGLATMASRLSLGWMTRAWGRRCVLVAGGVVAAIGLGLLPLPAPPVVLVVGIAAYGLAAGTVQPLTMSWMTIVTPRADRGVGASLRLVGNRVGQTVIPLAVAAASVVGGAAIVFAATGSSLLLSAWLSRRAPDGDAGAAPVPEA